MAKHKHAELIKAWADGATIEYFNPRGEVWLPASAPSWHDSLEYRIKPEPKPDREEGDLSDSSLEETRGIKLTISGETGRIKSVELLNK